MNEAIKFLVTNVPGKNFVLKECNNAFWEDIFSSQESKPCGKPNSKRNKKSSDLKLIERNVSNLGNKKSLLKSNLPVHELEVEVPIQERCAARPNSTLLRCSQRNKKASKLYSTLPDNKKKAKKTNIPVDKLNNEVLLCNVPSNKNNEASTVKHKVKVCSVRVERLVNESHCTTPPPPPLRRSQRNVKSNKPILLSTETTCNNKRTQKIDVPITNKLKDDKPNNTKPNNKNNNLNSKFKEETIRHRKYKKKKKESIQSLKKQETSLTEISTNVGHQDNSQSVIVAKRGTLKYLKQRHQVLNDHRDELKKKTEGEDEDMDFFETSHWKQKKSASEALFGAGALADVTLTIRTPRDKRKGGGDDDRVGGITPRSALLGKWGNDVLTPKACVTPKEQAKAKKLSQEAALHVVYHHLNQRGKGRRKNKWNENSDRDKEQVVIVKKRKKIEELPFASENPFERSNNSSLDDYFNDSL